MNWRMVFLAAITSLMQTVVLSGSTLHVPAQYPTIQDAVDVSINGDTIIVADGIYSGAGNVDIDFLGKSIAVRSANGPDHTMIDCQGNAGNPHRGFVFMTGEGPQSILAGFTIINGYAAVPGPSAAPPVGCGGGILCCYDSSPTIEGCIVKSCVAENCGGGMMVFSNSSPEVKRCVFESNQAIERTFLGGRGGGLSIYGKSHPEIVECLYRNNISESGGGGVAVNFESAPLIKACIMMENGPGGGLRSGGCALNESCSPTVTGCKVIGNIGAGIACRGGSPIIEGNIISRNSGVNGGGIGLSRGKFLVQDNIITQNTAHQGGGIFIESNGSGGSVNQCFILENSARKGGGMAFSSQGSTLVRQCTLAKNTAAEEGGGIYALWGAHILQNCTLWGNSAGVSGGGIKGILQSSLTVVNTILWDDSPDEVNLKYQSTADITCSNIGGGWPGTGNICSDPLFVDPARGDFHLRYDSPCRNIGDNSAPFLPAEDFEGDPRIVQNIVDMGADEFHYRLYHTGDVTPGNPIRVKTVGIPMLPVTLFLGSAIQDPPYATPYGAFNLRWPPVWFGSIGTIPAEGVLVRDATVPFGWAPGTELLFQALVGGLGGPGTRLTNLMHITVH